MKKKQKNKIKITNKKINNFKTSNEKFLEITKTHIT